MSFSRRAIEGEVEVSLSLVDSVKTCGTAKSIDTVAAAGFCAFLTGSGGGASSSSVLFSLSTFAFVSTGGGFEARRNAPAQSGFLSGGGNSSVVLTKN